ncbi:LacI family DNA-binding transcriptional regulator [Streptomyces sp. OE57]|uniref:LacI family DNA-binding transcriptional regulator n=1 Tax=Streptomyces lacaronensis TaxID=3379885 RepID=UPI0039B754CD
MRDVAATVGVSVKTVSNVVNATGQVNEATVRAVRATVEELGYRPNPLARGLNSRATDTVTLALPGLGYRAGPEGSSRPAAAASARRTADPESGSRS